MTKEEKELLLKDLCARLPYGVIVHRTYIWGEKIKEDDDELEIFDMDLFLNESVEKLNEQGCTIKPYLRPMSSMTKKERKEYEKTCFFSNEIGTIATLESADWLNAHHFDYSGLIEKGLALEAPKNMYKTE